MVKYKSVDDVFNLVAAGENNALFLDLDGTLIDFADHPDSVTVAPDLENVLTTLSKKMNGAVAVITGRDLEFIDRIFPNLQPAASASHGAVLRYENGGDIRQRVENIDIEELYTDITRALQQHGNNEESGIWIEKKDFACSIHWRNSSLPDNQCEELAREVADRVTEQHKELAATKGDKVIEIGPRHATKGQVMELFMHQKPFQGRRPVFFEDSEAGISGMEVVKNLNGLAVGVGPGTDGYASVLLERPEDARQVLRKLAAAGP